MKIQLKGVFGLKVRDEIIPGLFQLLGLKIYPLNRLTFGYIFEDCVSFPKKCKNAG